MGAGPAIRVKVKLSLEPDGPTMLYAAAFMSPGRGQSITGFSDATGAGLDGCTAVAALDFGSWDAIMKGDTLCGSCEHHPHSSLAHFAA